MMRFGWVMGHWLLDAWPGWVVTSRERGRAAALVLLLG
jgi:hypothetical protein